MEQEVLAGVARTTSAQVMCNDYSSVIDGAKETNNAWNEKVNAKAYSAKEASFLSDYSQEESYEH